MNSVGNDDFFFAKYYFADTCNDFFVRIDSTLDIACPNISGAAYALATSGLPPYTYSWNTTPVSNSSSITSTVPRYYSVTATDSRGCLSTNNAKINGAYQNDFDLTGNATASGFRPGVTSVLWLDIFNNGCTPQSGNVILVLDTGVVFNSAYPAPNQQNGDTLIWNFANMDFSSPHFKPYLYVNTSTSLVIQGTQLTFDLLVTPLIGDADTSNNYKHCHFYIDNSYDPNEKLVYPEGDGPQGKIANNQTMTYTIHFQNTGNADARNVSILDTLDTDLDFQSLHVVGSSHTVSSTYLLNDNVVQFNFDNINLPDSGSNQLGSNGYVIYEIEQKPNLPSHTEIKNTAYIYFDFNPAIVTNTVLNTIDLPTHIETTNANKSNFTLYPNPAKQSVTIDLTGFGKDVIILLYDNMGREMAAPLQRKNNAATLQIDKLKSGIYNIRLTEVGKGTACKSFVKVE